jgi:hypothetical protein
LLDRGDTRDKSNISKGDRLTVPPHDQLAALILRSYVTAMTHGRTYVQDRLDLLAFEGLVFAGPTTGGGIVLALGL